MLLRHLARFSKQIARHEQALQYGPRPLLALGPHSANHLGRPISLRYFSQELDAHWPEGIKSFLEREKIEKPTRIQEETLPIAMKNKNLVGIARTGSGKTLAFVIPAVMKVMKAREEQKMEPNKMRWQEEQDDEDAPSARLFSRGSAKTPTCLVLAPTRELAVQICDVFKKFENMGIQAVALYGGAHKRDQMFQLQRGADVCVATPGRLLDLSESGMPDLSSIKYLVLDEADRMLDMGFEPSIRRILMKLPAERQTLMWSATWPKDIQSLAREFLGDYEYIAIDSEKLKANPNIKQIVKICAPSDKLNQLLQSFEEFKEECNVPRVLIFVNTKRLADQLLRELMRNRIKATATHGNRSQRERDDALRMFRERYCNVLVATDVAARGLDVSDITHVVNFDFPSATEDYVHRIGRTARGERHGTAVTLFTQNESSMAPKLVQVLRETNQAVPEELAQMCSSGDGASSRGPPRRSGGNRKGGNRFDDRGMGGGGNRFDDPGMGGGGNRFDDPGMGGGGNRFDDRGMGGGGNRFDDRKMGSNRRRFHEIWGR